MRTSAFESISDTTSSQPAVKIRAVILDFHGVLYFRFKPSHREFFDYVTQEFGMSRDTLTRMFPAVMIGSMKPKEIMALMRSRLDLGSTKINVDDVPIQSRLVLIEENVELVRSLDGDYTLGMIADRDGTAAERLESFGLRQYFDCVIDSEIVGCKKPEAEIYRLTAAGLGCKPDQCVFVNDRPENVQGARAVGMFGILYSRHADAGLARQLSRLGVLISQPKTEKWAGLAS